LTATPIQNNLIEIFNLVTILKPGYLGTYEDFKKNYRELETLKQDNYLQKLIKKVMVRHLRKDTILNDVKRYVETIWITFTEEEQRVYKDLEKLFGSNGSLAKITYLKELCSSREACYLSLKDTENPSLETSSQPILDAIASLPHHSKAKRLVELIQSLGDEKVVVFTEYRATQFYLEWYLLQHNISSVSFRGGINSGRKTWLTELFKQDRQVFIAT